MCQTVASVITSLHLYIAGANYVCNILKQFLLVVLSGSIHPAAWYDNAMLAYYEYIHYEETTHFSKKVRRSSEFVQFQSVSLTE